MRITSIAMTALVAGLGLAGTALADTAAPDNVAVDNINDTKCAEGDCDGSATDMLVTDGTAGSLGDFGSVTLNFTANFCLTDGVAGPDLDVTEYGAAEIYTVRAGTIGGGLGAWSLAAVGGGTDSLDIDDLGITGFNQIELTDDSNDDSGGGGVFLGADMDGALCLDSVDADVDDDSDTDGKRGGLEMTFLTAYSDGSNIVVILDLAAAPVTGGKYRIYFDFEDDLASGGNAGCATTFDATSTRALTKRRGTTYIKDSGPGRPFSGAGSTLTYTVPYTALGLVSTDPVEIWADVHRKGIKDQSPDTFKGGADRCSKPQGAGEVLQIVLD